MSLSDVTFTEARTISGRKVNLIMANGSGSSPIASPGDKTKTVILEASTNKSMDGLHHMVSAESPFKKVSDIVIKPKVILLSQMLPKVVFLCIIFNGCFHKDPHLYQQRGFVFDGNNMTCHLYFSYNINDILSCFHSNRLSYISHIIVIQIYPVYQ